MTPLCPNLSNKFVKEKFDEMINVFGEQQAYYLFSKNGGRPLELAPNGADSILFGELLRQNGGNREVALTAKANILTNKFENWLNRYAEQQVSDTTDMYDENGEPLIEHANTYNQQDDVHNVRSVGTEGTRNIYKTIPEAQEWLDSLSFVEKDKLSHVKDVLNNYYDENSNSYIRRDNSKYNGLKEKTAVYNELKDAILEKYGPYFDVHISRPDKNSAKCRLYIVAKTNDKRKKWIKYIEERSKTEVTGRYSEGLRTTDNPTRTVINKAIKDVYGTNTPNAVLELIKTLTDKVQVNFEFVSSYVLGPNVAAQYRLPNTMAGEKHGTILINKDVEFETFDSAFDPVSQAILHEYIHAATIHAIDNSVELRNKLDKLLEHIKKVSGKTEQDWYGLKDRYELLSELVNPKFVEFLQSIDYQDKQNDTTRSSKIKDLIRSSVIYKIVKIVQSAVSSILTDKQKGVIAATFAQNKNNAYSDALTMLVQCMFPEQFRVSLNEPLDNAAIHHDLVTHSTTVDTLQQRITKKLSELYDVYRKMPNKSQTRQKIQNKLFEEIAECKRESDYQCVNTVIDLAAERIGLIHNGVVNKKDTVLGYLQEQSQLPEPFSGVTPDALIDCFQNGIQFYSDLINNTIPGSDDPGMIGGNVNIDRLKSVKDSISVANNYWKQALVVVTDKITSDIVDTAVYVDDPQIKENMKQVLSDYLHRNAIHGDLGFWYNWSNLNRSSNPIIKQAFYLTQIAEQQIQEESVKEATKIMKLFKKADTRKRNIQDRLWQTRMMEFDRNGIPTGYFVRPVNYGQYRLDLEQFIQNLNEKFDKKYGHHYISEYGTGNIVICGGLNDGELMEDIEKWDDDGNMPSYNEYLLEIEKWKCDHCHRRYNFEYYKERLSEPFGTSSNPSNNSRKLRGHGLSPKTLGKYNRIQSNINYYLDLCTDPDSGVAHVERLTATERDSLQLWQTKMEQLTNIFQETGEVKPADEIQTAFEIMAWQDFINDKTTSEIDYDLYNSEHEKIRLECEKTGDFTPLIAFERFNQEWKIDPAYIEHAFSMLNKSTVEPRGYQSKYIRQILKRITSNKALPKWNPITGTYEAPDAMSILYRNLSQYDDNPRFWIECKASDEVLEETTHHAKNAKEDVAIFQTYFRFEDQCYVAPNGMGINTSGQYVQLGDYTEVDLITHQEYLIQKYCKKARLNGGIIDGIVDGSGVPINFTMYTDDEIKEYFKDFFSYESTYVNEYGHLVVERKPLSIFTVMIPAQNGAIKAVPCGRFVKKDPRYNKYMDAEFDPNDSETEQPKIDLYDNSSAYEKVANDDNLNDLYEALINQMDVSQNKHQSQKRKFNYQLPKYEASDVQYLSRCFTRGYGISKQWSNIHESWTGVKARDDGNVGMGQDVLSDSPQMISGNIPLRYTGLLKDRSRYSYDVTHAVLMYLESANNYKYKTQIESKLLALRAAMMPENRNFKYVDENGHVVQHTSASDEENAQTQFDSLLAQKLYGSELGTSKDYGLWQRKFTKAAMRLQSVKMLGWNMMSILAGTSDAFRVLLRDSILGRFLNMKDLAVAMTSCCYYFPKALLNIKGFVANNKLQSMMNTFGIARDYSEAFESTNHSRLRRILGNSLMGLYTMTDFITTAWLFRGMCNNYKFYDQGDIPTGFYNKYQIQKAFMANGLSKKRANRQYRKCSVTIWDAYEFKDGISDVKPEYKQYVTQHIKTLIRTAATQEQAMIGGVNPHDNKSVIGTSTAGSAVLAMRGWMTQAYQDEFAGRDDTSVPEFEDEVTETVKGTKTTRTVKQTKKPKTDKQRSQQMSWNYSTGMPEPEGWKAQTRSIKTMGKMALKFLTGGKKHLDAKLSEVEKFAWKKFLIEFAMLCTTTCQVGLTTAWAWNAYFHNKVAKGKKEVVYTPQQFMDAELYKLWARNAAIRTLNSQLEQFSPISGMDVVNSISVYTAVTTDIQNIPNLFLGFTGLNDQYKNAIVKSGNYKGFTKQERDLYRLVGLPGNVHTAFTFNGVVGNTTYYENNFFGNKWLQAVGAITDAAGMNVDFTYKNQPTPKHHSRHKSKETDAIDGFDFSQDNDAIDKIDFNQDDEAIDGFDFNQ